MCFLLVIEKTIILSVENLNAAHTKTNWHEYQNCLNKALNKSSPSKLRIEASYLS